MVGSELDLSAWLEWDEGLPHPRWDLVEDWIAARAAGGSDRREIWTDVCRRWLDEVARALGPDYEVHESEHFLALIHGELSAQGLFRCAEHSRAELLVTLEDVAAFDPPGKFPLVALKDTEDYYRYISHFYSEGKFGGSAGVQIRNGHQHIALFGRDFWLLESTLAHELTHAALGHLLLPLWLEEGLCQTFEHLLAGRIPLLVDGEMAARHKRYWNRRGLDAFWYGTGFSQAGKVSELCYQLSEILMRLLIEESRPRLFGLVRQPRRRLLEFLRTADEEDCGAAACRRALQRELGDLAALFLGPGEWSPAEATEPRRQEREA